MTSISGFLKGSVYTAALAVGFAVYLACRKTPAFAYQGMIKLFCATQGRSNDLLSRLIGIVKRRHHFESAIGVLGDLSKEAIRAPIVAQLRDRGYYVFERQLPEDLCERLLQFATSQPCVMRPTDAGRLGAPVAVVYHRDAPCAVRYDFSPQVLLRNPDVQNLLADMSLAALAQDYLGAKPVIDVLAMWWHTNFSDRPDAEAAQYFHFDMDRPKWVKFFIYLTDVASTNGPHSFIAGSHKSGGIPSALLRKGYVRLMDEEIEQAFDARDVMEFSAPRGTIIVEDTRGLHKGKHVETGDRLMLQIQFSNSLFGGDYPKSRIDSELGTELQRSVQKFPQLYAAYLD